MTSKSLLINNINSTRKKAPFHEIYKPKNNLPKLEEYPEKGLIMAVTLNPAAQHFECVDRLVKCDHFLNEICRSPHAKFELYTELSPDSRIHYHGYIKIYDYFRWVLIDLPSILANFTIVVKPLNNPDKWDDYVTKQLHLTGRPAIYIKRSHYPGKETKTYLSQNIRAQVQHGFFEKYPSTISV